MKKDDSLPKLEASISLDVSVFLADLTYTQQTIASDVMPAAIGGLAEYAESVVKFKTPIKLFKFPEKLIAALEDEGFPDFIGFSNYIWNSGLSLSFARAIKKLSPKTIIVCGGPNYPLGLAEQEAFLRKHPEVDFFIPKEGEIAFASLIEAFSNLDGDAETVKRQNLHSVHSIGDDGIFYHGDTIEKMRNLELIPSPYMSGRMDEFFDGKLLPIIQTNRGCPFSCTFCAEGIRFFTKVGRFPREKVHAEIRYIGERMAANRKNGGRNDLFIADSNFGMYKEDIDTCNALSDTIDEFSWPEYINVATGKNSKERVLEASRIVKGAMRLSGSVQSLDPDVLENIKRKNISAEGLMELGLGAADAGANSYSEIILALPGDSLEAHYKTIQTIMDGGFNNLYLFQLMILQGTELATSEVIKKYKMDIRSRILPRCFGVYELLSEKIVAAEVDDICVSNSTLNFDDYLKCRKFHLIVTIFYNDGVFGTILKFLKMIGVSVFQWMKILDAAIPNERLAALFNDFIEETRTELWQDRAELEAFVSEPENVEQYVSGELGKNLLFVFKTIAITQCTSELAELAHETLADLLSKTGKGTPENLEFVSDALMYHRLQLENIFFRQDEINHGCFHYDIRAFDQAESPGCLTEFQLSKERHYQFLMDDEQKDLVRRYIEIYGSDPIGIGRILSKVYVRKLFRNAAMLP